jgi:hypothetical protein
LVFIQCILHSSHAHNFSRLWPLPDSLLRYRSILFHFSLIWWQKAHLCWLNSKSRGLRGLNYEFEPVSALWRVVGKYILSLFL